MMESNSADGAKIQISELSDPIGVGHVTISCEQIDFTDGKLTITLDKENPLAKVKTLTIIVGKESLTLKAQK